MPTIPLPPGGTSLGGGDLPVSSPSDVLAELPETHRRVEVAPVRDAFCEGFAEGFYDYQDFAEHSAAQCDPARATGDYLESLALEREIVKFPGETDVALRARMFAIPDIVSPQAIVDVVNALLAPYSDGECQFIELELDGYFVHDGDPGNIWDSFVGAPPRYPDRYYEYDASENEGFYLENNLPGGAIPSRGYLRSFVLRLPDLSDNDIAVTYIIEPEDASYELDDGQFVGDGSDTSGSESSGLIGMSIFVDPKISTDIYASIVAAVESIKGQGITWSAVVDPEL